MKKGPRTGGLAEHGLVNRYRIPGVGITVIGIRPGKNSVYRILSEDGSAHMLYYHNIRCAPPERAPLFNRNLL